MNRALLLGSMLLAITACGPVLPSPSVVSPPPASAAGSLPAPESRVILRVDACPVGCDDPRGIEFLADGRVVRREGDGRLLVRQLSADGLSSVRERIARDGSLLGAELRADPTLAPGATVPPYTGFSTYTFYPTAGGPFLRISTVDPASLAGTVWRPTATMERLASLARDLLDVEGLAGGEWLDPAWTAWEPGMRYLFLAARAAGLPLPTPDVGAGGPLDGDLALLADEVPSPLDAWPETRCRQLSTADAETLLGTLPVGTIPPAAARPAYLRLLLGDAARERVIMLIVVTPFADEAVGGCSAPTLAWVW
jgi:hypothetical protein